MMKTISTNSKATERRSLLPRRAAKPPTGPDRVPVPIQHASDVPAAVFERIRRADHPPLHPITARIPAALAASGWSRSELYRRASRGEVVLKKCGRTTLVDMASLRAAIDALPQANIRPAKIST